MKPTFSILIFFLVIWLLSNIPMLKLIRENIRSSRESMRTRIRSREWVIMIFMPIEGLACYHLLDDFDIEKPAFDWQYVGSLIAVPTIVTIYFISRKWKDKVTQNQRSIMILGLLAGIVIAIIYSIRFYQIGILGLMVVMLAPPFVFLALPYYALLAVVILLIGEIICLVKYKPVINSAQTDNRTDVL